MLALCQVRDLLFLGVVDVYFPLYLMEAGQELDSFKEAVNREKILIYGN